MRRCLSIGVFMLTGVLFLIGSSAPANAVDLGVRGYYFFTNIKTDIKVDTDSIKGTRIDAKEDLGLGYEAYPSVEVYGGLGKHHLSLTYMGAEYSDGKTLTKPIIFNGTTFDTGTAVDTDLKINMIDLEYQYDFLDFENILAGFSLGIIGKIKYLDIDAKLKATSNGLQESSDSFRLPIPMIGMGAHVGILADILEARAKLAGIGYSSDNMLYEAMADISFTPFPFMDIHGGYKIIKINVDQSDFLMDSEFSGPYIGLTIGF